MAKIWIAIHLLSNTSMSGFECFTHLGEATRGSLVAGWPGSLEISIGQLDLLGPEPL